jgi:hypothetical protein
MRTLVPASRGHSRVCVCICIMQRRAGRAAGGEGGHHGGGGGAAGGAHGQVRRSAHGRGGAQGLAERAERMATLAAGGAHGHPCALPPGNMASEAEPDRLHAQGTEEAKEERMPPPHGQGGGAPPRVSHGAAIARRFRVGPGGPAESAGRPAGAAGPSFRPGPPGGRAAPLARTRLGARHRGESGTDALAAARPRAGGGGGSCGA